MELCTHLGWVTTDMESIQKGDVLVVGWTIQQLQSITWLRDGSHVNQE